MANEGADIQRKLLAIKWQLRQTPDRNTQMSPYEMMFGRTIRTRLQAVFGKNNTQVSRHTNPIAINPSLRSFRPGQRVQARNYVRGGSKWVFATVERRLGRLHYELVTDSGERWKRHINQILLTRILPTTHIMRIGGED